MAVCRRRQWWGRRRLKQADCSLGDSGGDLRRWRWRRAAEGGGGSSVDVLDGLIMCGSDFPLLPVQACGRNSTKAKIVRVVAFVIL